MTPGRLSNVRFLGLLVGALLLFAVIFQIAETLVGRGEFDESEVDAQVTAPAEPIRPLVTRTNDRVEVRVGDHRTTVTISSDPEQAEAFASCVREALDREMLDDAGVPSGWVATVAAHGRVRQLVDRAVQGCLTPGLPPLSGASDP